MSSGKTGSLLESASSFAERAQGARGEATAESRKNKIKMIVAAAFFVVAGYLLFLQLTSGGPDPGARSRTRPVIDGESSKVFPEYEVGDGTAPPYLNPDTGRKTLWPAELCYRTRDGKIKAEPTYVLIRKYVDPNAGETLCPDCGKVVYPRFPAPPSDRWMKARETGVPQ